MEVPRAVRVTASTARDRAALAQLEHRQCETARHNRAHALGRRDTRHYDATVPSSGSGRQPPGPLGVLEPHRWRYHALCA